MTEADHLDALAPGYRMHWYTIERVLGQGGFGITYLARDTNLDQRVAIKEYLPVDVATRRPDATVRSRGDGTGERFRWGLDRFLQEARTLARFDHPNIVRVHSVFEFNGTAYMVMRFEEGENLGALLERRGNLSEKELLRILLPVLDGLELVHNAGFIHRDIKPDNIHIRTDGSPVLLDFGSARLALGKARTLTILVAPGYAPFEQYYSNSENQGPWTDIYGLGATCYRAISGMAPLDAITRSKGILGSTREVLVPARNIGAGRYSGQFLAAIDHALAFAEKDRPQTIAAWRAELTLAAPHADAAPLANAAQEASAIPASAETAATSQPAATRGNSLKGPLLGAVTGAILAAAGAVVWMQSRDDPRISEIERRLEVQRVKDEQARKEEQTRQEAERRRLAEDEERNRQRIEQAKKTDVATTPAAIPRPPPKKPEAVAASPPPRREAPAVQPVNKPPPVIVSALESVASPPVEVASAQRPTTPITMPETAAAIAPMTAPPAAGKPPEPAFVLPKDDAGLLAHYRKLALQGDSEAALKVGEMYEAGRGVAQSNNWAYSWYAVAERRGVAVAKSRKDAVGLRLQPRERVQGEHFAERQAGTSK